MKETLESSLRGNVVRRRGLADTVGFAHLARQMDAVMQRIEARDAATLERIFREKAMSADDRWRMAIVPHDDYAYVGVMYPLVLEHVKAGTVIVFGVAHKARQLGFEDQLVFDSFTHWRGPYGDITVSPLRDRIMRSLPEGSYRVSDEMHSIEHSVEAKLPFLQYYDRNVQFVPILVPFMSYARMNELALPLARAIAAIMDGEHLAWGKDIALISSTDAVHYGDEGWGGRNFALYGVDAEGYAKALLHEQRIMSDCFDGELQPDKIERFTRYTLDDHDPLRPVGRLASPATAARETVVGHDPGLRHVARPPADQGRRPRGDGRHRAGDAAPLGGLCVGRIPVTRRRGRSGARSRHSAIVWPEPPNSFGKSLSLVTPSFICRAVS